MFGTTDFSGPDGVTVSQGLQLPQLLKLPVKLTGRHEIVYCALLQLVHMQ